jgi:hypothetical protein
MKYFTYQRFQALQDTDGSAMDAADAAWQAAVEQYDAYLQTVRPDLPGPVQRLLDGFYYHDARVLSLGQRGDVFVISLQLDVPPNELLTLSYVLAGPPDLRQHSDPGPAGDGAPLWQYEELEVVGEGSGRHFVHSILFDNGWELRLPFRDVQLATTDPIFPRPRTGTAQGMAAFAGPA